MLQDDASSKGVSPELIRKSFSQETVRKMMDAMRRQKIRGTELARRAELGQLTSDQVNADEKYMPCRVLYCRHDTWPASLRQCNVFAGGTELRGTA